MVKGGKRERQSSRQEARPGPGERADGKEERSAKLSGGEPDITLRCVLGSADWALRAHRLAQQTPKDTGRRQRERGY